VVRNTLVLLDTILPGQQAIEIRKAPTRRPLPAQPSDFFPSRRLHRLMFGELHDVEDPKSKYRS